MTLLFSLSFENERSIQGESKKAEKNQGSKRSRLRSSVARESSPK